MLGKLIKYDFRSCIRRRNSVFPFSARRRRKTAPKRRSSRSMKARSIRSSEARRAASGDASGGIEPPGPRQAPASRAHAAR